MNIKDTLRTLLVSKKYLPLAVILTGALLISLLFFNSRPAIISNRVSDLTDSVQTVFFTPVGLPDKLDFAHESVPMQNFDVRESLDRELLSIANFHSQALLYLKKTHRYFAVIEPILKENGIPDDFKYLALAESGFLDRITSPAGAVGIWQFMKTAAIESGLEVNEDIDERYHLEKATEAACRYLKNSYAHYGNWTMVAASYNAGMAGINKQMDIQESRNYYDLLLNEETARYLFRILALKLVISNPVQYGFQVKEEEQYPIIPVKEVKVNGPIKNFAEYAREHHINYKLLKQFNPWLRQSSLRNPTHKEYLLKIPETGNLRTFDGTTSLAVHP